MAGVKVLDDCTLPYHNQKTRDTIWYSPVQVLDHRTLYCGDIHTRFSGPNHRIVNSFPLRLGYLATSLNGGKVYLFKSQ
jgi:hypothetical protein